MGKTIRDWLSEEPGRSFLMDRDGKFTREDCANLITERVHGLRSNGLSPGDLVAAAFAPSVDAVIWILSVMEAGLIVLPVNIRQPASIIGKQLKTLGVGLFLDPESSLQPGKENYPPSPEVGSLLISTSGTTAEGKWVRLDWPSLLHGSGCAADQLQFGSCDRWLMNLPLYHVGGLAPIWRSLVSGGAMVMPGSGIDFSHISMVGTQLRRVVAGRDEISCGDCRIILLGGGPVPDSLLQDAVNQGLPIVTSYGMTETGSLITVDGFTTGSCEVRISGEDEIQVRGPGLFTGYFDPITGKTTLPLTADGWFRTGDLGCFVDSSRLRITGRRDNQFISGGENIQPEEIESALLSLGNIRQAVVVGVPDEEFGMRPVAFVDADDADIAVRLEQLLPRYKIPIKFFDLPEDYSGRLKPSRKELSKLALQLR
ncbi:MAG: AMP-binding protein [Gemmatimonadales bacterium]|nr:AMP-binding protein [Gemmatimonadales bacterium]